VAVFAPADRGAPHVQRADAAFPLPGDHPQESYLNAAALIDIARRAGATAVHPGYGFLAEHPGFAGACEAAGLRFIGPPPQVLALCGDKARTRETMAAAGVPVLPGTGALLDQDVAAAATRVGYPLLVKAAGGGGGKGIHLVRDPAQLAAIVRLARGEAQAAFGDGRIYLERWLDRARHIEVQILADPAGRTLALGERDCSVQRRHQKLIEETPAPGLPAAVRARLVDAALAGAKATGYVNAGTFEFLVSGDDWYFLEVNARLQVEHPVTEMVTGVDLVAEQLRITLDGRSRLGPAPVQFAGHAIECRISAEDPHEDFLPCSGRIEAAIEPGGIGVRVDSGVQAPMMVTRHFDPLLAKVIAWAPSRAEAIARMRRAIAEAAIAGIPTSIPFHLWALEEASFVAGEYDTGFARRWEERRADPALERTAVLAAVASELAASGRLRIPTAPERSAWRRAARADALR
jgi:acetyl-CoA carboxylase, biotin carboxylase subunit